VANIYDVAKRAGVSVATVSAVINRSSYVSEPLQERVQKAIAELNYSPNLLARSLAQRRTHTLGILVPDVANPFFPEIVRGAEDKANDAGYMIILGNSDNQIVKEEMYLNLFLSKRVDGILLVKAAGDLSNALFEMLRRAGPPVVLIDREYSHLGVDTVVADDSGGAYTGTRHLLKLGHRRIGIVIGIPNASTTQGRLLGYREALASRGVPFDPELVVQGDYGIESGYAAGLAVLAKSPSAVFVTNYMMTIGFMKALEKEKLRCPQDVAVVSYDDFTWNEVFHPRLTCVVQPKYLIGYRAAEILLSRIQKKHKRVRLEVLQNDFVVRESSGRKLEKALRKGVGSAGS